MTTNPTREPIDISLPSITEEMETARIQQALDTAAETQPRYPNFDVVFLHVLQDVIGLPETSVIYHQDEVYEILDLITMSQKDIQAIHGVIDGQDTIISKRDARLLTQFTWWHKETCSQTLQNDVDDDYWLVVTKAEFTNFHRKRAPALVNPTELEKSSNPIQDGVVGPSAVLQFQKSIKLETSQYPEFKGSLEGWLPFKRKLKAIVATHGIERIIQDNEPSIVPQSQDYRLYQLQNNFLYSVFTQKLFGGPAILALRAYEDDKDARKVFLRLVQHYESTTNLMVISQKCHARIQSLKLHKSFRGGAQSFVTQLQNAFLDLEYCTGVPKNDLEKKTTLLLAIEDDNYHAIRDHLAMDSSKDYFASLAAIDQHATMFVNQQKNTNRTNNNTNTRNNNNNQNSSEPRNGKKKKPKNKKRDASINNITANQDKIHVEASVWEKLPGEVKKFIAEHNKNQKGNSKTKQNNESNDNNGRTNNKVETESQDSDEHEDDDNDDSKSPSIRSILRAASKTANSNRNASAVVTRQLNQNSQPQSQESDEKALIDSGADTCCMGPAFKITSTTNRSVNVYGYDKSMVKKDLVIGEGITLATNANGDNVLLRVNEGIIHQDGKSILSVNQMRNYQVKVNDIAKVHGGHQNLTTLDGHEFLLEYDQSLMWIDLKHPSEDDLDKYPIVDITSDIQWNPSNTPEVIATAIIKEEKAADIDKIKPCLGWKPMEVIEKTLQSTTQYAKNNLRLPMRQHFKARNRGLYVKRLRETFATDTFFSSEKALNGETCAQIYVGKKSHLTEVFGMTTESQMAETLQDFIRKWGAPDALLSDNAKSEISKNVKRILREYGIKDMQTEPHHPNQNLAERRIQDVKNLTNTLMDRTGTPPHLWYLATEYSVYLLNHLASRTLKWKTPIEVSTGETPDISNLLQLHWYQQVYYYDPMSPFPQSKEKSGRFVGIAENVGDILTYKIMTDTEQVICRSVVRPTQGDNKNYRADNKAIDKENEYAGEKYIFNEKDLSESVTYPEINPEEIIGFKFIKGRGDDAYHAEVLSQLEENRDKYIVKIGDSGREEIFHYNHILQEIDKSQNKNEEGIHIFKEIIDHRRKANRNEVKVLWGDDTETWEPLRVMAKSDPVTCANYAKEVDILHLDGWKSLKKYVKKDNRMIRTFRQATKMQSKSPKFQFGIRVPMNYREAMALDKANGNKLWHDAIQKELDQIKEYETFITHSSNTPPEGYQFVCVHFVFAVKHDLRRKARLVAGGHMTNPTNEEAYSSVVTIKGMRMCILLAELNNLEIMAGDVGNAYLEAKTREKIYIRAGPEFGDLEGRILIINKALYGLRTSGARYCEHFADYLRAKGWNQSRADPDIWMKDKGNHWEYICTYVDDLLVMSKNPKEFMDELQLTFKMKGIGPPTYHLGADFTCYDNSKLKLW